MAKVQFNCRLDEEIAEWIATESALKTVELKRKFSQADVITLLVAGVAFKDEKQSEPRKLSKKDRAVAELAASDITAQAIGGRPDVEYGSSETVPRGQHVTSLDATANAADSNIGKASTEIIVPQTRPERPRFFKREMRPKGDKTR